MASLLDTRGEVKIATFRGDEKDWGLWFLRFESYSSIIGWKPLMDAARDWGDGAVPLDTLGENALQVGQHLYYLLLHKVEGKAIAIVRSTPDSHGLEAWRLLKTEYEVLEGGSTQGMLRYILNPGDRWRAEREAGKDLMTIIIEWSNLIAEYQSRSGEVVTENIQVSTLLEHLPSKGDCFKPVPLRARHAGRSLSI